MNGDFKASGSFTQEDLKQLTEQLDNMVPQFNSTDLDDFVAKGNAIDNVIYITPAPELKNVTKLKTKHGMLMVQYSEFVPYSFIMRKSVNFGKE